MIQIVCQHYLIITIELQLALIKPKMICNSWTVQIECTDGESQHSHRTDESGMIQIVRKYYLIIEIGLRMA